MYSRTTLLSSTGTGLRSLAKASAPTRKASSGIAPPPANGSTTNGRVPNAPPSASCAAWVSARLVSRYSGTVELSQLAKSAIKSSSAPRSSRTSSKRAGVFRAFANRLRLSAPSNSCFSRGAHASICLRALSMKDCGHCESAGSGHNAAQITARQAARGRRAHQMWSVEMCPCLIDFSRRACAEIRLIGRSTSMRRLG